VLALCLLASFGLTNTGPNKLTQSPLDDNLFCLSGSLAPFVTVKSGNVARSRDGLTDPEIHLHLCFSASCSRAQLMCEIIWEFSNFPYKSWVIASPTDVVEPPLVPFFPPTSSRSLVISQSSYCMALTRFFARFLLLFWVLRHCSKNNEMCIARHKKCKTIATEQRNMFGYMKIHI